MRILFVSNHFPEDLSTKVHGVYKRFQMFLNAIKEIAEIDLLYYVPARVDTSSSSVHRIEQSLSSHFETSIRLFLCKRSDNSNFITKFRSYTAGAFIFHRQPAYIGSAGINQTQAFETCLGDYPDAIFVHRLGAMCPLLRTRKALPPVFFDLDDIEHVAFKRSIRYLPRTSTRIASYLLVPTLFWGQYRSVRLSHRTFVCSEVDRRHLISCYHLNNVSVIPNAVKIPEPPPPAPEPTLLFLGSYNHKPNIDAVEFLIRKIWPHVHQAIPEATLIIAGSPPERIPSYNHPLRGVRFTGFVENLDELYQQARVVCAPILSGSGTRVKIIEAASYSRPIVSTQIGAEGIELHNGDSIFLRDDPKSFAEACIRLLIDHELCERMGAAARASVIDKYDQSKIERLIQDYITVPEKVEKKDKPWIVQ